MTFNETVHQIYRLAYNMPCIIDDVEFTSEKTLKEYFKKALEDLVIYPYQQKLPDGDWWCFIAKISPDFFDYYVPETREQEQGLLKLWEVKRKKC